jgi:hypothetical protein
MTYFPPRNLEANILKKREDKTLAMTDDKNEENPKVGYRKTLTNVKATCSCSEGLQGLVHRL